MFWLALSAIALLVLPCAIAAIWLYHNRPRPMPAPRTQLPKSPAQSQDAVASIPKRIWSYWHQPQLPQVVASCVQNWRHHNPDFDVVILHAGNLHDYLPDIPEGLSTVGIPKQTDWIRLALLQRYGGYWLDASLFLTQSLHWAAQLQQQQQSEFVGFYLAGYTTLPDYPVVESWFLGAPLHSRFINDWLALFQRNAIDGKTDDYLAQLKANQQYSRYTQNIGNPAYHTIHVAAQHVLQTAQTPYRLALLCAEDTAYAYQAQSHWKRLRLYARLLWHKEQADKPALVKLRGGERSKLEPYLARGWFRAGSPAALQLMRKLGTM